MPLLIDRKTQPQDDVIVVGSGAGGGMAALRAEGNPDKPFGFDDANIGGWSKAFQTSQS